MSWSDLGKRWRVRYQMVTPANLDSIVGDMDGVIASGASVTESYYTDTRVQASLSYVGGAWQRQTWIRIIAEVPDEGYSEELGTFLVSSDDASASNGEWTTSLSLESSLYALSVQAGTEPWTCCSGSMALPVMKQMLDKCHRAYIDKGATDYRFGSNLVYETGTTYLERLYDLADLTNTRLDVDGHGRVTLSQYVAPKYRTPTFTIDLAASDGIAQDGLSRSSDYLSRPTECVVYHQEGSDDDKWEVRGIATNGGHVSYGQRGYVITKVVNLSDMSPATWDYATQQARERLNKSGSEGIEWTLTTEYMPVHAGDVGYLQNTGDPEYGARQTVMVKERTLDLEHMTMQLTLKLVGEYDTDGSDDS
jgi:hypothetical protein